MPLGPRYGHGVTRIGASVFLFGGRSPGFLYHDLWEYNLESKQWTNLCDDFTVSYKSLKSNHCPATSLTLVL